MSIDNRLWAIITTFVCVVLVALGWFLGVQPQLAAAARADQARVEIETKNAQARADITTLEKAEEDQDALAAELAALRAAVPAGVDGSAFIAMLDRLVAANGVQLTSASLADPEPYAVPAEGELLPPTNPLITSENFVVVPVVIEVKGDNETVLNFLSQLQSQPRLVLVTDLAKVQAEDGAYTLTVSAQIFVLRDPVAEDAADAADAETETETPAPAAG